MAWIESHQSLLTHRKTLKAAELLGISRVLLIGHLHILWWWALDNSEVDGTLHECTPTVIAEAAGWSRRGSTGRAEAFVKALLESGFLEATASGYALHNWYNYAGKLNEKRAKDRERKSGFQRNSNGTPVEFQRSSSGVPAEVAGTNLTSSSSTNQPYQPNPTDLARLPRPKSSLAVHPLNFAAPEWTRLTEENSGVNVQARWKEWVLWIDEDEEKRRPKNPYEAFSGWLRKASKNGTTATV